MHAFEKSMILQTGLTESWLTWLMRRFLLWCLARDWRALKLLFSSTVQVVSWAGENNGSAGAERLSHSLPGSPADRRSNFEVIGSAESLVGRVSCSLFRKRNQPFQVFSTFLIDCFFTGTRRARTGKILWSRIREVHIKRDARSPGDDSRRDGPGSSPAFAAGTSRSTDNLPVAADSW